MGNCQCNSLDDTAAHMVRVSWLAAVLLICALSLPPCIALTDPCGDPATDVPTLIKYGQALGLKSSLDHAERCFLAALSKDPTLLRGYMGLADLEFKRGRTDQALQQLASAAAADPKHPEPPLYTGHLAFQVGRTAEAVVAYKRTLELSPTQGAAYNNLGLLYKQSGMRAEAEQSYRAGTMVAPSQADSYVNLGTLLSYASTSDQALPAFLTAAKLHPDNQQAVYNAGLCLKENNQQPQAIRLFDQALQMNPAFCSAAVHKGLALASLGDREAALQTFLAVIEAADGGCALAHSYLGPLRLLHGFNLDVVSHCEKAIELEPTLLEGYGCLSTLLMVRREYLAATQVLESVTADGGGEVDDVIKLAYAYQNSCNWRHFKSIRLRAVALMRERIRQGSRLASQASWVAELHGDRMTPAELLVVYRLKTKAMAQSITHLPRTAAPAATAKRVNKLVVGYASSDLRDHPVGHALLGLTQWQSRSKYSVIGYSLDTYSVKTNDSTTAGIVRRLDKWLPLGDLGFSECVTAIQDHGVHILVNTNGYTRGQRNEIWALGAAPLGITLIGASTTIGAEAIGIQYASADIHSTPPDQALGYGERLVVHPTFHHPSDYKQSYGHLVSAMISRMEAADVDRFYFGNFNRLDKLHPHNFAVWMHVLRRTSATQSEMKVLQSPADSQQFLEYEAAAAGIRYTRMGFYGMIAKDEHLVRMASHDLCLDTTHVNGMTTALDVAYGGLPMVATVGERMNNRFAGAVMQQLGLGPLGVRSLKEYEDLSVK